MPALKLGRLPGQIPVGLHELGYYAAGPLPSPPAAVPVPAEYDWQLLGNDTYGDCGVAGLEHGFMADAATAGESETFPDAAQAISYYLTYTGGKDDGVVLSAYLAYVRQHGYYDHTVKGYAPVAVHDVPTLQTAVWLFGFAYTGIRVTEAMEQAFGTGQAWTAAMLGSPVIGGHCVPVVGYGEATLQIVTWGAVQEITYPAWHLMADEAYGVLTGEFVARNGDGRGINLAALEADLNRLSA